MRLAAIPSGEWRAWCERGAAAELREPPLNVPRLLLHPRGLAPQIINLDEWAWHVIDALRQQSFRNPDDKIDALAHELATLVPEPPRSNHEHIG